MCFGGIVSDAEGLKPQVNFHSKRIKGSRKTNKKRLMKRLVLVAALEESRPSVSYRR